MQLGGGDDAGDFFLTTEIAGIDANGVGAIFHGSNGQPVIKMDVGNQGDGNLIPDNAESPSRFFIQNGDADKVATGCLKTPYLRYGLLDIPGIGIGHGLHRDRRSSPDGNTA
jgi:hypothetical protein